MKLGRCGLLQDAMFFDLLFDDLDLVLQVKLEIGPKYLSPVWPNLDVVG